MSSIEPAVGNLADLGEGEVLLPGFVSRESGGLFIDLLALAPLTLEFHDPVLRFVERVFTAGTRFADLDYELFLKLLFLWEPADISRQIADCKLRGREPRLRLARDIVPFPGERRDIYRGVKIAEDGATAEYLFEQIVVERKPADSEAADGSVPPVVMERLYADFDEFVAALWEKGVRFGIDAKAVTDAIARDKAERLAVAVLRASTEGKDASIAEQTDLLHRDDAPRLLPDGRMDLHHYRNRFPQVRAGTRLFKKVARVAGISGWNVLGQELAPAAVKDFNIETLAGPGTQVLREGGDELVVAARDGFLDIDAASGAVSVVDKIISREGVSMRTTGDLSLAGDEYEEHGEVQEKRVVKGHHMTFLAPVFGKIVSDGGRITLRESVSGGEAHSPGGSIVVEGLALQSVLEAQGGTVVATRAEGCRIVAGQVSIERAVNCDIVADKVSIDLAEGCAIAARVLVLKNTTARRDEPTTVTVLLPDLASFDRAGQAIGESRTQAEAEIARLVAAYDALAAQPDMRSYLAISPKLRDQTLIMSAAQQTQWQALLTRLAPTLRQVATLSTEIQAARQRLAEADKALEDLGRERQAAVRDVWCLIEMVSGDTQVQTLCLAADEKPLANLAPKDLRLRRTEGASSRLFFGGSGSFEWRPPGQEEPPSPDAAQ